jgi:glucose-6-phosphate isomerase
MDYSKQPVNGETIQLLIALAQQQRLEDWIARMFAGEKINSTEHRAALHIALRSEHSVKVDDIDVMPDIQRVLAQMERFSNRHTQWRAHRLYGQAFHRHRQYWHWRLGPRPGDGDRSAQTVSIKRYHTTLCLKH